MGDPGLAGGRPRMYDLPGERRGLVADEESRYTGDVFMLRRCPAGGLAPVTSATRRFGVVIRPYDRPQPADRRYRSSTTSTECTLSRFSAPSATHPEAS